MTTVSQLRQTPLHSWHVQAGARMVEFGGWDMPVQYSSILKEHAATRSAAGLFDISHMGELRVRGSDAAQFLNTALTNNVERVKPGQGQYSLLLNERGGIVDDLFVYMLEPQDYLLVVNASHIEEDFALLNSLKVGTVDLQNNSDELAAVALQGPASAEILDLWISGASARLGHHAIGRFESPEGGVWIARTGYTGEDGFEIICASSAVLAIWENLLVKGSSKGLLPCALGARDTLRMEVCYPLNGHELGPDISPMEAGVSFFVDFTKPTFQGKEALLRQKESGVPRKSVALLSQAAGAPPRAGYPVVKNGQTIGIVTSGCLSPTLQKGIALALVDSTEAGLGNSVDIEIRGKYLATSVTKKPFYKKPS